ncbi:MAG: phosphoribosylglycinamide formyltransferase [Clostridia bacterium]|nr:phosphoribosylglycinamide formyltransferase [Clostridia bacterium]
MKTIKTAVLCSGGGTNLQAIIDSAAAGALPHAELALVVGSKPGIYALERATAASIPSAVVARREHPDQAAFEAALCALLEEYEIEVIVLAGFLTVLSESFVKRYPERILNVHPSLIPSFCGDGFYGLRVHEAALEKGVKVTGATVHFVNEITDGGRIIAQKAVEVKEGDTPETLQRRVMEEAEWKLLPAALETVCKQLSE